MNRQKELEKAARRIKALKELTNKIKVTEKLVQLEKESAWIRRPTQTKCDTSNNNTLEIIQKLLNEKYNAISELRKKMKNNKSDNLVKIEQGLKDIEYTLLDFSKSDDDVFFAINSKLNVIKDFRIAIIDDINWKKINELKELVDVLEDAKLIIIKSQVDEKPNWLSKNID